MIDLSYCHNQLRICNGASNACVYLRSCDRKDEERQRKPNGKLHQVRKLIKRKQKSASEIQNILNIKSGENKKKPLDSEESRVNLMAEDEGFEPPQTESESGVLPLHKSSIC